MVDVPRSIIDRMDEERVRREMIENLPPPSVPLGVARSVVGQGLGMGFGDEGEAWIRSKLGQGSYEDLQKGISKEYGRFAEQYPITSGVGEFVGGAAPSVAALMMAPATGGASLPAAAAAGARSVGALSRMATNPYARSAAVGAVQGGTTGAGTAEQDERLSGAVGGTIMGTGIGAVAPGVIRGAGSGLNFLRERILPSEKFIENRALGKVSGALKSDDMKPSDIYAQMYEDRQLGAPSLVANTSESLADLADVVAQRSGAAARTMRDPLERQKGGSRERVMEQVRKGMGSQGDFFGEEDRLMNDLQTKAKPYYKAAYDYGEVTDPKVLKYLELPQFKDALGLYEKSLEARGKKLPTVPVLDASGKQIGERVAPTVEILDQVKRNLDDLIEGQTDAITRKRTTLGDSYKDEKNSFLEALDKAVPDFGKARSIYKGDAEVKDALNSGMNEFGRMKPEQVTRALADMGSDAERDAFRTGATRWVQTLIMNPSQDFNAAKRIINSPELASKMEGVFDSPAKFNLFRAALEKESEMFQQASRILGGSPTQRRQMMQEQFDEGSNFGETVVRAVTGGNLGTSLASIAARAVSSLRVTDDVAQKVAKMLSSSDPREVSAAVKLLEDFDARQAPKAQRLGAAETGTVGGTVVALPSAPSSEDSLRERDMGIDTMMEQRVKTTPSRDMSSDLEMLRSGKNKPK